MKDFHCNYIKVTPKWKVIRQEFKLLIGSSIKTNIVGFNYEDENVKIDIWGNLTVKEGFIFGASGPTIDTNSSRRGSCFHDALYYLSQIGAFKYAKDDDQIRLEADKLIRDLCIEDGMYKWRAWLWYRNLRLFGGFSWNNKI